MDALSYGGWLSPESLQAIYQGMPIGGTNNGGGNIPGPRVGPPGGVGGNMNRYLGGPPPQLPQQDMYDSRQQNQPTQQQQRIGGPSLPQMAYQQQQQQPFSPRAVGVGGAAGMGAGGFSPRPQQQLQPWSGRYVDNYGDRVPPPVMSGSGVGYPNYPPSATQQQGPPMPLPPVQINQQSMVTGSGGGGVGGRYDNNAGVGLYPQQDPGFNMQQPQMASG